MNRKIVYIILVALAILLLVALLWWWFLRREATVTQTTGTFGSAQNAQQTGGISAGGPQTNVGTGLPGQLGTDGQTTQTNIQLGNVGVSQNPVIGSGNIGVVNVGPPIVVGTVGVPGVTWLSGSPATTTSQPIITTPNGGNSTSTTAITGGPGTVFDPTAINPIAKSNPVGNGGLLPSLNINSYGQQVSSNSTLSTLGIAAAAGLASCLVIPAVQQVAQALATAQAAPGQAVAAAVTKASAPLAVSTISLSTDARIAVGFQQVATNQLGQQTIDDWWACLTKNLAKILLQQITSSVVNWINSGFNGSPAFVQNPTQFLQQTADKIAGSYIQSSALSFLCSPFQLQVKIAIAQSYANRGANSCTLSKVSNNITSFMRGTFSTAGGWPAFLSMTSVPTNNPYGAFLYGSIGITSAAAAAQNQVKTDLLQSGGFLSFQQKVPGSCITTTNPPQPSPNKSIDPVNGPSSATNPTQQLYQVCDYVSTTPGRIIASSLESTLKGSIDQVNLAKSFDDIITALMGQLVTRTLQNGLSNLSGQSGYASNFYTTDQLQAQTQINNLVAQMQSDTGIAGQYASVQQGSIQDIESAQSQLNDVVNCWNNIASQATTTAVTPAIRASAIQNASDASTTLNSFNATINGYNNRITQANTAIVTLEQLESRALSAASASDVTSVQNDYNSAKASGQFPTQTDVTNAQQNRSTLQSQLASTNQQSNLSLQQCNAIH